MQQTWAAHYKYKFNINDNLYVVTYTHIQAYTHSNMYAYEGKCVKEYMYENENEEKQYIADWSKSLQIMEIVYLLMNKIEHAWIMPGTYKQNRW